MNLQTLAADATQALHRTQREGDVSTRTLKALVKEQAALGAALQQQSKELAGLRHDLRALPRPRSGFPWPLVLLAGGAYAAYRYVPAVQDQVRGLLGRLDPGTSGNLHRASEAAQDAVHDVTQGRSSGDALGQVGGELRRTGEKSADAATDQTSELRNVVRRSLDKHDA